MKCVRLCWKRFNISLYVFCLIKHSILTNTFCGLSAFYYLSFLFSSTLEFNLSLSLPFCKAAYSFIYILIRWQLNLKNETNIQNCLTWWWQKNTDKKKLEAYFKNYVLTLMFQSSLPLRIFSGLLINYLPFGPMCISIVNLCSCQENRLFFQNSHLKIVYSACLSLLGLSSETHTLFGLEFIKIWKNPMESPLLISWIY